MLKTLLTLLFCSLNLSTAFADTKEKPCAPPIEVLDWFTIQAKQMGYKVNTLKNISLDLKADAIYAEHLCALPALNELDLRNISDLNAVAALVQTTPTVKSVRLNMQGYTSLCADGVCPLGSLTQLKKISIFDSQVNEFPLGSLPATLTELVFAFNNLPAVEGQPQLPFGSVEGLLVLAKTAISLNLDGLYLTDLSFLREFTQLKVLHLYDNKLTTAHLPDLVASPSSATLEIIYLDGNLIEDMTLLSDFAPNAWAKDYFEIRGNPVKICPVDTVNVKMNTICANILDFLSKQ